MRKDWFKIVNDNKCPKVYITGLIGQDEPCDYNSLRQAFDELKNYPCIECYVNSGGGDMVEGFACYDHIMMVKKLTGVKIDMIVIGMAASMASVLIMAGDTITMTPNSLIMIHRPQANAKGESQVLRDMADLADKLEGQAVTIYTDWTGLPEEKIKSWMLPGKMTWMNATEAEANKITNKKYNGGKATTDTTPIPKPSNSVSEKELWNSVYNKISLNQPNSNQPMKLPKLTLDKLSLTDESSDAEVSAAIDKLVTDKAAVDMKLKTMEDAEIERNSKRANTLVDNAIASKKFSASEKETYVKFALSDYESAEKIINKLPGVQLPNSKIKTEAQKHTTGATDRSEWTFDDWRKKDSKGLAEMRATLNEAYQELLDAHKLAVRGKINIAE